jgi:hypothetical protein
MSRAIAVAAAVAAGVLAGCVRTVVKEGAHPAVRVPAADTGVKYNNVAILDDALQNRIAIEASNWRRTETGTAEVWVQIRNRTDFRYHLEARVQFFDQDRVPLGKPSAWQRVVVGPNEISTYRENSTEVNVGFYYVEIREGR